MDWIDIKKEEPKEKERVLVCFGNRSHFFNPCIAKWYYITGRGGYWTYEPNFISSEMPTHWIPLPSIAGSVELPNNVELSGEVFMTKENSKLSNVHSNDLLDGFFIYDVRVGCVAVYQAPKRNCLEGIGNAAIYYRRGTWDEEAWDMPIEYLNEAKMVCQALNTWKMIRGAG